MEDDPSLEEMLQRVKPSLFHKAQFIASFPNRDPGTQTTASTFFRLPLSAIRATTGLSEKEIQKIMKSVAANLNPSLDSECAKRCGIKH
uniref:Uncharacterized protein n=1 Tax=Physcomitrium patens TaxID=3218 RepID=A0A2K1IBF6_PHYPA|nr:hypothetical protein PHYPA_030103 [Physcomitrium patens]